MSPDICIVLCMVPGPNFTEPLPFMPEPGQAISQLMLPPEAGPVVTLQSDCLPAVHLLGSDASSLRTHCVIVFCWGLGSIAELTVVVNSHSPGSRPCCECAGNAAAASAARQTALNMRVSCLPRRRVA